MKNNGSILVSLLWIVSILSLIVVGVLHSANLDLRVVKNYGDSTQAHYIALAGIEKAKALLYQSAVDGRKNGINFSDRLFDAPQEFRDIEFARGRFRVCHGGERGNETDIKYGVLDEERFLNFNTADQQQMIKLEGMTEQLAAAISDYRDGDQQVSPGGAELAEYEAMQPPYIPHDAPFRTLRELLSVRDMPPNLFLGEDANANGWLDPEENDGRLFSPQDNQNGVLDKGWMGLSTVWSAARNVNAYGKARVNIKEASQGDLAEVDGITEDLAKSIVEYRDSQELNSLGDLLKVKAIKKDSKSSSRSSNRGSRSSSSGGSSKGTPTGSNLINRELFKQISDSLTVSEDVRIPGAVNVNTAPAQVLASLPGMDDEKAAVIVAHRSSIGFFQSIADLLDVEGISEEDFKQLVDRVTTRSDTFRIFCEGKVTSSGARRRMEVVVRISPGYVDTLAYREDL